MNAAPPVRLAVLGASGRTGRQLVRQALEHGHEVVGFCRDPASLDDLRSPGLRVIRVDLREPRGLAAVLTGVDVVVSGLGNTHGQPAGVLEAGLRAVLDSAARRVVWLGAFGTATSRRAVSPVLAMLLGAMLRSELEDKERADELAQTLGASIIHAGPLTNGRAGGRGRLVAVETHPRRFWPPLISRADLASLMIAEALNPKFQGTTAVALAR